MTRRSLAAAVLVTATLVGAVGCSVGPNYVRPSAMTPNDYKERAGDGEWKTARPSDGALRGPWWDTFGDPLLSTLETKVSISNQNLLLAEAQFRQARALVLAARSQFFPTATVGVGYTRSQPSQTLAGSFGPRQGTSNDFVLPLDVSWEADIWGRIRRNVEANRASAQASAGDLEASRLLFQSEVAQDYFQLRTLDAQRRLLDAAIAAFQTSLQLTRNRYAGGVASDADVAQAETQLKTTQAQATDLGVQRAQLEHAIAVLIGQPPATFAIPFSPLAATPPSIPVGVPSELLERRPDIAAAERRVAAANAQIGVAVAAYYPTITLSASAGFESGSIAKWLMWPSRFFSVGPAITETVFDGGLRSAQTAQARAAYDASVASYRETVLGAFQDVEDNLAALRILETEAREQDDAVRAAERSLTLTTNQYRAGVVSYLNVVVAQTAALTSEQTAAGIAGRRLGASVLLIKALGGGWSVDRLPTDRAVTRQ
jgi:NodT family efflux transporter outer membrane factor (OMF) lipoprotein